MLTQQTQSVWVRCRDRLAHVICWRKFKKKWLCIFAIIGITAIIVGIMRYIFTPDDIFKFAIMPEEISVKSGIHSLNCKLLAQEDAKQLARAKQVLEKTKQYPPAPEWLFLRSTRHCDKFIHDRGYVMNSSSEEQNFPLAFSVRMHDNIAQTERLLRAIYRPQNIYCIHIDRASEPIVQTAMRSIISCFPNVLVSSLYTDFVYRSFSPVEADLQCMRQLLLTGVAWRYYLNVAGTEFPLRTNLELVHVLKRMNGMNDIEMLQFPDYLQFRITYSHFVFWRELYKNVFSWKAPFRYSNITIYKGSSYNMFSRDFVRWLLGNRIANELIDWSRDTHSPDETVWATLNGMTGAPGGYVVNSSSGQTYLSRAVLWCGDNITCQGAVIHDICIFGYGDLKWLAGRQEMFANKFNINYDPIAYECLERSLWQRIRYPDPEHSVDWEHVQRSIDKRKQARFPRKKPSK